MPGVLDLTWKPTATSSAPAAGQSAMIYRGDTYAHVIEFWNDAEATDPFEITGTVAAQIRATFLDADDTAGTPLATFAAAVSGAGSNIVTISLTATQTLTLPAAGVWDLQVTDGSTVTTLLRGKVKVLDDATRVA